MNQEILAHYKQYSQFTYPGLYEPYLQNLPDELAKTFAILRNQRIHRVTVEKGLTGIDATDEEVKSLPWWRQAEDDNFNTAAAILAELFRRDNKGLTLDRNAKDKLILTCRHTTLLVAATLKAKGIPARVRSGYAPYFPFEEGISSDHWINEYFSEKENRWISIDVDGYGHKTGFDMFDMPKTAFDYPANAWLAVRSGKVDGQKFFNAAPARGLKVIGWALFYDFHCLMNNEIIYLHTPAYLYYKWDNLTQNELQELDKLAEILLEPDKNFKVLKKLWEKEKKYRFLKGSLL